MAHAPTDIFIKILAEERVKRNIAIADLARKLNFPPKVMMDWERGKRYPRLSAAMKWSAALGIALDLRHLPNG